MNKSITETLKKINIELKGSAFLSIIITFIILNIYILYKIINNDFLAKEYDFKYEYSNFSSNTISSNTKNHFIYASKRGTKYYYYYCKANIKEENKIFFDTDIKAQNAGYTLAKTCK